MQVYRDEYSKKGAPTGGDIVGYKDPAELEALSVFKKRDDFEAMRIQRLLELPDLTRKENSPVKFVIDQILKIPEFRGFDVLKIPETVSVETGFDLLNVPADHPSRQSTDSYFVDRNRVLRTQTTAMWPYYLSDPEIRTCLQTRGYLGALCYGKVYRKDEIDRSHFPVFHQIDGLYISRRNDKKITLETLQGVLSDIIKSVFGANIEFRFLEDTFPFTHPSTQVEIKRGEGWLEVVGGGLVHDNVLKNLNLDPGIYNGWAFGFGLERLAMIKNNIPDIRILWSTDPRIVKQFVGIDSQFKEVSKYPAIMRDISFVVDSSFVPNDYFDLIRDIGGDLVEEVSLLDKYENAAKFGAGKVSYTYRIVYRSTDRTLKTEEINPIQDKIVEETKKQFKAEVR